MKPNYSNILIAGMLVLMASTARIVNTEMHLYNLAPLAALGLFSGAVIKEKRYAILLPLLGQLLADVYFQLFTNVQGFYGFSQLFVYAGLAGAAVLGSYMKNIKAVNVALYTLGASTLFFIVSNFGTFLTGWNGRGIAGLETTYIMGIPFFKYTVAGDMAGSILLFGAYYLLQQAVVKKMQKAQA